MEFQQFTEIASRYKAIFFDAFGVLKNHRGIFPGVDETFTFLDDQNIDYYVVTNDASRSPELLARAYQQGGVPQITADRVISSGMLASDWLQLKIKSGKIAYMGPELAAYYVNSCGLPTISINDVNLEETDDISCLVFLDDEGFDWNNDINKAINLLRKENITAVVANTDANYPVSRTDIAVAAGGISSLIEQTLNRQFIKFGKPDALIYMFAYEMACRKQALQRNEILMVGDTLFTDIIGGNKFGTDTVLVLSGNTRPENAEMRIRYTGIIPTYICTSVTEKAI